MIEEISAVARVSFKQATQSGDVFYTYEYGQKRTIYPNKTTEENNKELWDDCIKEVNEQIINTKALYKS